MIDGEESRPHLILSVLGCPCQIANWHSNLIDIKGVGIGDKTWGQVDQGLKDQVWAPPNVNGEQVQGLACVLTFDTWLLSLWMSMGLICTGHSGPH